MPGGPPPWQHLAGEEHDVSIEALAAALEQRGQGTTIGFPDPDQRESAVLVPVYTVAGVPHVVLTRRPWHMRSHRGEVSFPGGGAEPGDESLWHTALREAFEEVALDPSGVSRIGELDRLLTVGSRSLISPHVGLIEVAAEPPGLVAAPEEVEQILHVPVRELLLPEVFREEIWYFDDRARTMTFFELEGNTVWGATAAMLRQLLTVWLGLDSGMEYIYDPG